MRKVKLRMNEEAKYLVIKKLIDTKGNKQRAAISIGCSKRQINRMIVGMKKKGKAYFVHGNRNRAPSHRIDDKLREEIMMLYQGKYEGANFTHFTELLLKREGIQVSKSFVSSLLNEHDIISPMANKKTRKMFSKRLKAKMKSASSKKEKKEIQYKILDLEDSHPRRPRKANFGELIQMDASVAIWFGQEKAQLHLAIDDCTGSIVGAYFDKQETLQGYYQVFKQILENHGIPYCFLTDRRTVFEYNQKGKNQLEKDTFTQFAYACKQLGTDIRTTSIPEAKGRVERMFRTLKSRLITELRLQGATTLEQANEVLNSYIKEFNDRFALNPVYTNSVFESSPTPEKINLILAVLTPRKIDSGHCIRFSKAFYKPVDELGTPLHYPKGTPCMVIQALDGSQYTSVGDKIHALEFIPDRLTHSKEFGEQEKPKEPVRRYIPSMTHPWKAKTFGDHVRSQTHYSERNMPSFGEVIYSTEIFY